MKQLRVFREAKGWSQARLAREAELNAVTVSQAESGRFRPYPGQLQKLATALGYVGDPQNLLTEVMYEPVTA